MFEEIYSEIFQNVDFRAMDKFEALIKKTITGAVVTGDDNPGIVSVSFKLGILLEGLIYFANSKGKEKGMDLGAKTMLTITNALQFELDESEAFLLYYLHTITKFRKKESELLAELKRLWVTFPEYKMEDLAFSHALKFLMREKFINYRKGNLQLNPTFIIRYRV